MRSQWKGACHAHLRRNVFSPAGPTAPAPTSCAKSVPLNRTRSFTIRCFPAAAGLMVRTPDKRLALDRFAAEAQTEVERR